jgi:hypothetical protein
MSEPVTIPLVQGEQVWTLLATDKFGLSADDLLSDKLHGLGVALDAILSQAKSGQPVEPAPWQELGTGGKTFRIGSARPVEVVSVSHDPPVVNAQKVLADRNAYPGDGIPSVVGQSPWYVTVKIWWRAPDTTIPWPAFTSLFPALPDLDNVNGAEWALSRAVVPAKVDVDPGDASWGQTQVTRASEALKLGAGAIVIGVALVGGVILLLRRK